MSGLGGLKVGDTTKLAGTSRETAIGTELNIRKPEPPEERSFWRNKALDSHGLAVHVISN